MTAGRARGWALAAALVCASAAARAEPPSPADQAHRAGKEAFARGDYPEAAARFDEALRLSGDVTHLFNLAQALRLAGDCPAAYRSYRIFLAEWPDAPNRADVEAKMAALEGCARPPVRLTPVPVPAAGEEPVPALVIERRAERRSRTPRRLGMTVAIASGVGMFLAVGLAAAEPEVGMPVAFVTVPVGLGLVTGGVIRQVSDSRRAAAGL